MLVLPGGGAEEIGADQTHDLERTVTDSLSLNVTSVAQPTEIEQTIIMFPFDCRRSNG